MSRSQTGVWERDIFNTLLLEWEQVNGLADYGEIRFNAIGLMQSYEVFAVYTE
jgi:hypothetical protein